MPKIPLSEPWQHRSVEANGLRFRVVTAAPAGGGRSRGLVLLLHGFPKLTRGMRAQFSGPFRIAYLPGVSHWVQQEAPAKVNTLLTRCLAARVSAPLVSDGRPRP